MRIFNTRIVAPAIVVGALAVLLLSVAPSFAAEGRNGNNIVCGGVPTKSELIRLANGGADKCGNKDIAAVWAAMGITPELAKTMRRGTVCASGGWISSGRQHSPNPSEDIAHTIDGHTVFFRPLAVWGNVCYDAWTGVREDGIRVAVLVNCGNGETPKLPPKHKPKPKRVPVRIRKLGLDANGRRIVVPKHTVKFSVRGKGLRRTVWNAGNGRFQLVGKVKRNTRVKACELQFPKGWALVGPRCQVKRAGKKGISFTFVNKQLPKSAPKPKTWSPMVRKIAVDAHDNVLPAVPTNTFHFRGTCGGKTVTIVLMSNPQTFTGLACQMNETAQIEELTTSGWHLLDPKSPVQPATASAPEVVFKNMENAPTSTPAPVVISINQVQEIDVSNTQTCCINTAPIYAQVQGPPGHHLVAHFTSATTNDTTTFGTFDKPDVSIVATGGSQQVSSVFTAPTEPGNARVMVIVFDQDNSGTPSVPGLSNLFGIVSNAPVNPPSKPALTR